ncbi:MAG: tyrosine-type recombinase/integrase [Geobacteraceae bacterium]
MAVKACPKHKNCFLVDWRPQGKKGPRCQRHFPGTETEAYAYWQEMVRLSRRARHVPVSFDPKVSELVADWKDSYKNDHRENTFEDLKYCLVPLVKYFGNMHLSEISAPIVVEQYKSARLATEIVPKQRKTESDQDYQKRRKLVKRTLSKRTVAKELAYFSSFLRWCHEHGYTDQQIRIRNFSARQTARREEPMPLHREDVNAIIAAMEPEYLPILLVLVDAGLRRAEALTLTADQVDLRRRVILVRGKGGKTRVMPITTARLFNSLKAALEQKKKGLLFANPKTGEPYHSIRKPLQRAAEKAGIDQRLYHHLFRHTFGTTAIAGGLSPKAVQDMMGHVSMQTTDQYIHLAGAYYQAEAAKFAAYIEGEKEEEAPEPAEEKDTAPVSVENQ